MSSRLVDMNLPRFPLLKDPEIKELPELLHYQKGR
jgi:hypothetical protein